MVSMDRAGHVGPTPGQLDPEGGRPTPPWPVGLTLAPTELNLGAYAC
jgi:hypothetical protein